MRFYTQQHKHYCGIDLHVRMNCASWTPPERCSCHVTSTPRLRRFCQQ